MRDPAKSYLLDTVVRVGRACRSATRGVAAAFAHTRDTRQGVFFLTSTLSSRSMGASAVGWTPGAKMHFVAFDLVAVKYGSEGSGPSVTMIVVLYVACVLIFFVRWIRLRALRLPLYFSRLVVSSSLVCRTFLLSATFQFSLHHAIRWKTRLFRSVGYHSIATKQQQYVV